MSCSRLVLVAALGVSALLPVAARASDARVDAFGVQREYLEDYILFTAFPTVVARYQNLVTASVGDRHLRNRSMGVIASGSRSSYGVFAIYLNDVGNDLSQDAQLDVTWAKEFGGMTAGLGLDWNTSRTQTGEFVRTPSGGHSPANLNANQMSVTGGVKLDLGEADRVEAAAEIAALTWEDDQNQTTDDGRLSYRLAVRMMREAGARTVLVPLAQYQHVDLTARGDPDETTFRTFNLGVAAHHQVNGNDLLILGIAANYLNQKQYVGGEASNEFSRWDLPALFIALEFDVYDWLTGRVGATRTIDFSTSSPVDAEDDTDRTNSRYFFGLGMGLHFDHFDVDATVNPDALFTGGYLFSGTSSVPLGRITATYYF